MKVVSPSQMRDIDKKAIEEYKIPGIILMENAAIQIFDSVIKNYKNIKKVIIFSGKGNNGGDGFALARLMFNYGLDVVVYTVNESKIKGDAKINLEIIKKMNLKIKYYDEDKDYLLIDNDLKTSDIIIDGIFGTGLNGKIEGSTCNLIKIINNANKKILSIDIPSGLNGKTGEVMGTCIKASRTVTLCLPKLGLYVGESSDYIGKVDIVDINIPKSVVDKVDIRVSTIDMQYVENNFPKRFNNSNKGTYGKLFLVTGSSGMTGAGIMSAKAGYRTGTGLFYLGVPKSLISTYELSCSESVVIPLEDRDKGYLDKTSTIEILDRANKMDVVGIGPGLSNKSVLNDIVEEVISGVEKPMVLDADCLNIISNNIKILKKVKGEVVITPHPGEMARLLNTKVSEIQKNRIEVSKEFAKKWNVVVVLKGYNTLVASPNGDIYINRTGNNGMATAGSGDVLTGIIMSLIGQGLKIIDASNIGVYLHGLAGDLAAKNLGKYSIVAGDIIENLPNAINSVVTTVSCE